MSSSSRADKKKDLPSSTHHKERSVLPDGWIRRESRNRPGKWYYFNENTGESTWYKSTLFDNSTANKNKHHDPVATSASQPSSRVNRKEKKHLQVLSRWEEALKRPSTDDEISYAVTAKAGRRDRASSTSTSTAKRVKSTAASQQSAINRASPLKATSTSQRETIVKAMKKALAKGSKAPPALSQKSQARPISSLEASSRAFNRPSSLKASASTSQRDTIVKAMKKALATSGTATPSVSQAMPISSEISVKTLTNKQIPSLKAPSTSTTQRDTIVKAMKKALATGSKAATSLTQTRPISPLKQSSTSTSQSEAIAKPIAKALATEGRAAPTLSQARPTLKAKRILSSSGQWAEEQDKVSSLLRSHQDAKEIKETQAASSGTKRKVNNRKENESKKLKTCPPVTTKTASIGSHWEEKKRQKVKFSKKQKKAARKQNSSTEPKQGREPDSRDYKLNENATSVIPSRKPKLLKFFNAKDKEIDEDASVPMDIEMEDVEAEEVKGQLNQIRDELNNSSVPLDVNKLLLPAKTDVSSTERDKEGLHIILDTNVLISHLTFLEELRDHSIKGLGKPVLCIPWVVLQELDGLKTGHSLKGTSRSKVAKQAIAAGHFIHTCIKSKHPRVQGQSPMASQEFLGIPVECNDDRVLQCCLQYKQMGDRMLVVLFSNDVNLCTKAMVSGINAYSKKDLLSGLKDLATSSKVKNSFGNTNETQDNTIGSTEIKVPIMSRQQDPSNISRQQGPSNISSQQGPSITKDVTVADRTVKMSNSKPAPAVKQTQKTESDLADEILSDMKKSLTEGLSVALETEMEKAYGDQWLSIVLVKPPWTFKDLLRCFEKHWIAVFGMYLTRGDKVFFKELNDYFKKTQGYTVDIDTVGHLLHNAQALCTSLLHHDKNNTILHQSTSTLTSLIEKCNKNKSQEESTKGSHSSSSHLTKNTNNTSANKLNKQSSSLETPERSYVERKQTVVVTTASSSSSSPLNRDLATSISTQADRRLQKLDGHQLDGIHDDGDVEMVLDERCGSLSSDVDSVLQVFQSVGETVFNKSASILSAVHQSTQLDSHPSTSITDSHIVARSLLLLCSLLLTVVTAMARLLQGNTTNDNNSYQEMCDALDLFMRECEINPAGSGLHPASFQHFMSVQSNIQTLANGLRQFAEKLQELHEHLQNLDVDLYTRCRQTLIVLARTIS